MKRYEPYFGTAANQTYAKMRESGDGKYLKASEVRDRLLAVASDMQRVSDRIGRIRDSVNPDSVYQAVAAARREDAERIRALAKEIE